MKRRQMSFPILRFAAAAFVAASTTVHAGTAAPDGGVEAIGNNNDNTTAANTSTPREVVPLSSLEAKSISSPPHNDPSPRTLPETAESEDDDLLENQPEEDDLLENESEADDLWENESGIVYGGFGWRHDKRGSEGGGDGYSGPGGVIVLPPPFLFGGHYPKTSSGASRPRPFGFLRG
ncbi:hypothetical protein PG994_011179 [Apiospora phragmitis]|uniref:Uncharacterized protein n=1 Tax=Apiospora phragmitis TaxID=2905665 RepID=A0ABR1TS62_9PEZI